MQKERARGSTIESPCRFRLSMGFRTGSQFHGRPVFTNMAPGRERCGFAISGTRRSNHYRQAELRSSQKRENMPATPSTLYLRFSPDDLYRFGNSTSPRLDHVREQDEVMYEQDGETWVRANGKGISLVPKERAMQRGGWIWMLPKNTVMPLGLALHPDRPSHVSLCATHDMPLHQFCSLLLQVAVHCKKVGKV